MPEGCRGIPMNKITESCLNSARKSLRSPRCGLIDDHEQTLSTYVNSRTDLSPFCFTANLNIVGERALHPAGQQFGNALPASVHADRARHLRSTPPLANNSGTFVRPKTLKQSPILRPLHPPPATLSPEHLGFEFVGENKLPSFSSCIQRELSCSERSQQGDVNACNSPTPSGIEQFPCGNEGYDPENPTQRITG